MSMEDNELLHEIHRELKHLTSKVESAFVKDEDGNPDYSGHRLYHRRKDLEHETLQKSKNKVLSDVATWLLIGFLTIVGSALVQVYIIPITHR